MAPFQTGKKAYSQCNTALELIYFLFTREIFPRFSESLSFIHQLSKEPIDAGDSLIAYIGNGTFRFNVVHVCCFE